MSDRITVEELSELMKKAAGVTVPAEDLQQQQDSGFDTFGIDSLGLLGIVGELENRYGTPMPPDAERSKTPRQFLDLVNSALLAGA
ncbi:Curamycin polyketide synthase acyl carrier protein [Streptomyces cyaneogriseus subsp. noncyanogenus]|jgi:minimal PKS acyl carrier protein|uniref:Curamycin polyketide synthase acyl carrier protein n=1 Tax=Streptomyces cyaneogriseus subsp. noncyanogenus TaxID=477245 RepID=A0A0C5FSC8_9ACTN|nr:acyl carrier protein [Streptomyces cyaneogriseus]AJP00538.1 Curamycin polyketide synthase acyl carrier protein [Streptomyces cyaneogriseus subsp. noncyanogenus]